MNTKLPTERKDQIKFFINKFEATKEEEWCTEIRYNGQGQSCALGKTHAADKWDDNEETLMLQSVLAQRTGQINNGWEKQYQQPTPRQRILAALNDKLKETIGLK